MKSIAALTIAVILLCGCATQTQKVTQQRGWVGGSFTAVQKKAWWFGPDWGRVISGLPNDLSSEYSGGILVADLQAETPLAKGGLREGDLILKLNGNSVTRIKALREAIDSMTPGSETVFVIYREGVIQEHPIVIGREQFKNWHHIAMGLGISSSIRLDPVPDPDFSLVVTGLENKHERIELSAVEQRYLQSIRFKQQANEDESGVSSEEGWKVWLAPFWVGSHKEILAQEIMEKPRAVSRSEP